MPTDASKAWDSVCLPKGSEFLQILKYHISLLRRSGVLRKRETFWLPQLIPSTKTEATNEVVELGFENLMFPFAMLAGIVGISFLFLLPFEMLNVEYVEKKN